MKILDSDRVGQMGSKNAPKGRRAVTLVELLVVMGLVALLMTIGIYFLPSLNSQARGAQGATLVQGWFNTARVLAARDRKPRGVRLIADSNRIVRQAQYIQTPEDFAVGQFYTIDNTKMKIQFNFPIGSGIVLPDEVEPGDYFEALGGGMPHLITSRTGAPQNQIVLASPIPFTVDLNSTNAMGLPNYRIIRSPRIADDDVLQLPKNVIINLKTNQYFSREPTSNNSTIDVVFAPNGRVVGNDATLYFWVHEYDSSIPRPTQEESARLGTPTIVAIYARTGLIASYPVDITYLSPLSPMSNIYGLPRPYSLVR